MDEDKSLDEALGRLPGRHAAVPERLVSRADAVVARAVRKRKQQSAQRIATVGALSLAGYATFAVLARPSLAETVQKAVAATAKKARLQLTEYTFDTKGKVTGVIWRTGDFSKGALVREESRDTRGLRRLDLWRDGRHWLQAGPGAATLVESAAPIDFRGDAFLAPYDRILKSPLGKQLREIGPQTEAGRKLRVFVLPMDTHHQLRLYFDATSLEMVRSDELEVQGTGLLLRRRVDVASVASFEPEAFAPLPGAVSPEALVERVRTELRRPAGALSEAGRMLSLGPVLRNPHGDLFVLYRDAVPKGDPNPSSLEIDGAYCQPDWFELKVGTRAASVDGDSIQGRWFVARTEGAAPPSVTVRYRGQRLVVRPQPITGEMPYYGGLFDRDDTAPREYLRALRRSEDARYRQDPKALLSAADGALAAWPSLPTPYDLWLRRYGLADRTWALQKLGDRDGAARARRDLEMLPITPGEATESRRGATGWSR